MRIRGFTLVEIMIVVAIVALLAAMSVPNLLRSRLQANESAAQAALKTIATGEIIYRSANAGYGTLVQLSVPAVGPSYIEASLAAGIKNGYSFSVTDVAQETFHVSAVPLTANVTGIRSFCVTEDGVVRVQAAGQAIIDRNACLTLPAAST